MQPQDVKEAMIGFDEKRGCLFLRNWRWFDVPFEYRHYIAAGSFQGLFDLRIPDHVKIISHPEITAATF